MIKDDVVPGNFVNYNPGTRRYTEGTTNYKQYFKIGILHRYPGLDETTVQKAFDKPELLIDSSFFEQIQQVNVFLRESLISFIVNRISGGSDVAETVKQLSNVLQRDPKILDTMDELGKDNERLN